MNRFLLIALTALLCADNVNAQTVNDDFSSYAQGSDGSPKWEPENVGWEVCDNAYIGDTGTSVWRAVPFGSTLTFSCDVTVLEQVKGDWLVGGIGLYADERNYWGLQFVAAPEKNQRRHQVELQESLAGQWLATSQPGSKLPQITSKGTGFNWQLNQTYRFEINLDSETLTGRVLQGSEEVAKIAYKIAGTTPAVRAGRPVLRAHGLRVRFDNAHVEVTKTATEPTVEKPHFPAWTSRKAPRIAKGAGFFRTIQKNGRWWLVDPEGKAFFDVGTDHVSYRAHWCEALGYAPYHKNVEAKFGSEQAWGSNALQRLKAWGFNALPAGHTPSLRHQGLPHILFASFGSGFAKREWIAEPIHWTGFPDVFSPRWPSFCRMVARKMARESVGDPWCIGTFLDNELEWYGKKGHLVDEVFKLTPTASAKKALLDWLLKRWGTFADINRQLGANYADDKAFLAAVTVPKESDSLKEVRESFLKEIADRYFRIAASAMREADPDHLVLGCRFAGRTPDQALEAAGKYNDVYTFNTYPRVDFENDWTSRVHRVPRELLDMYRIVQKPMIITEWSFPALDSGLPCKHGAGMRVDTQEQKAACYRIFANAMIDLPFMVGYHYFMWADEPAPGISSTFPEDSNYGLVNEKDETYTTLVATATEVNRAAAARHALSESSGELDLRAIKGGVEIANTNSIPSHAVLRISSASTIRTEKISLKAKGIRRIAIGGKSPWCAELKQWDGTRVRVNGGSAVGPLQTVNYSTATWTNVPVVVDGPPAVAGIIPELAPGHVFTLEPATAEWTDLPRFELKSGETTWICERRDGSLFSSIRAGDLPMGRLTFAVHQQAGGRDFWTEAEKIVSMRVQRQKTASIIEAVVEHTGPHGVAFRAGIRIVVFNEGSLAQVKPLWVESTAAQPWRLVETFLFCRPAIGGSPADDEIGSPMVPNYYRPGQFFTDKKLGGCFGVADRSNTWLVQFWKDEGGSIHPDARLKVDRDMRQGERWAADAAPYLSIYARRDAAAWRSYCGGNNKP